VHRLISGRHTAVGDSGWLEKGPSASLLPRHVSQRIRSSLAAYGRVGVGGGSAHQRKSKEVDAIDTPTRRHAPPLPWGGPMRHRGQRRGPRGQNVHPTL
jgi:hypothetical protein